MIDIGVNLTNSRFEKDVNDVISRAQNAGVTHLMITGTNIGESQKALSLCNSSPELLYCTAGVHPHDADNVEHNFIELLRTFAAQPSVKAIGECGLDFNRNFSTPANQIKVFEQQIALAKALKMPLFLHQREAFKKWFSMLTPYFGQIPNMVTHCFTGNAEELQLCLDAGMYVGITGWLCDEKRGEDLRNIVNQIPLNRLMIETDAPFLTPKTIKPKPKSSRNEPSYLPYIVKEIAKLTDYSEQEIMLNTRNNAIRVFELDTVI